MIGLVLSLAIQLVGGAQSARAQALDLGEQHHQMAQARPWLGVAIEVGDKGVLVKDALEGTPAVAAGITRGDQITQVDDIVVHKPEELIAAVLQSGVGNTVTVRWLRGAKTMTQKVKLVARPDELAMLQKQLVGKPVPPFDLKVVRGDGPGTSEAAKGKVTIVEFWATWCPACRSTHTRLSEFAKTHQGAINVVAISDEELPDIKAYADRVKPGFTVLADTEHKTAGAWFVSAIPQIAVVDKTGTVTFATVGAGEYLEQALAAAEKAAARK